MVIPPEEVWEPIQAIRREHDRQIGRWMPHINLLYPFRDSVQSVRLTGGAFELTLTRFRFFLHGPRRFTIWLEPEPREPLIRLQRELEAQFPDCDDLSKFENGYTPHLSVGQSTDSKLAGSLQESWQPIRFEVTQIFHIVRDERSPFRVARAFAIQ